MCQQQTKPLTLKLMTRAQVYELSISMCVPDWEPDPKWKYPNLFLVFTL